VLSGGTMSDEVFESISHPLRIRILKLLAKKPRSFSELKRELGVKSSGKLDFHLKKLGSLITVDENGKYTLTKDGYAALEAIHTIKKFGWQKRAYFINLAAYIMFNIIAATSNFTLWLMIVLPLSTAWIAYYTYKSVIKRKIFKW